MMAFLNFLKKKKIDFRLIKRSKQLKGHSIISGHTVYGKTVIYLLTLFLLGA